MPRTVPPSSNVTVPVGVPAPGASGTTVDSKVTVTPTVVGLLGETTRDVAVAAWFTVKDVAAEVLPAKLLSPLY